MGNNGGEMVHLSYTQSPRVTLITGGAAQEGKSVSDSNSTTPGAKPTPATPAERMRRYRAAHPDRVLAQSKAYRTAHRDECRARCRASRIAHHESRLEYERMRRKEHPDEISSCERAWRKNNPEKKLAVNRNRRARLCGNGGTHTAADVWAQYKRQNGKCYWCREKLDSYHVDHVVPIVLGGSNGPENLVVACPACNLAKGSKHPMEYAGRLF